MPGACRSFPRTTPAFAALSAMVSKTRPHRLRLRILPENAGVENLERGGRVFGGCKHLLPIRPPAGAVEVAFHDKGDLGLDARLDEPAGRNGYARREVHVVE